MVLRKAGGVLACLAVLVSPLAMAAGKCERLVATGSPIHGRTPTTRNT